ncbi:Mif2/CENP-C like-domain-containing protein [Russula earlei]|uniref:Mif2/CENP-C like-domain-containing protein n=1 Tax=Russula earlei TaxID=71964 RepID=A0ACC0UGT1_9AGAM|nr:Mif2/CENP-C like-domain-containing protein [Russula earlei]
MPTTARQSSLGASRRVQQRAHLPFRADDLGRGKRTGLPVPTIEHKSDDFEPFDEILSHADTRAAWHGQKRPGSSKKRKSVAPVYEDEDGGDMSMELDDYARTSQGGPIVTNASAYFSNVRNHSSPLAGRAKSASRAPARASDVDYDAVPSPRPRKSFASSLRRSSIGLPLRFSNSPPDAGDDVPFHDDDLIFDGVDDDLEDPESPSGPSKQPQTPRRLNHSNAVQNDEDETPAPTARSKGKAKATNGNHRGEDVEEEISRGLEDVEMQQEDEDEEVVPKKKPAGRPRKKRALPEIPLSPESATGLRRGKRLRYEPLEWWRCEKVVYGRRDPGKKTYVPTIKEIVRIPKDPTKPFGIAHKSKRGGSHRKRTEELATEHDPEEGWDDKTPTNGVVVDWFTGNEVSRRLAFPGRLVNHRPAANSDFFFTKVFGDGEYIAAGQLRIPPKKNKPSKMTKDNTYVFYVIEGAVTFKVHESSYVLCTGGMILVPRGNTYYIENIAERDARLFFAQARRVSAEEESPPEVLPAPDREITTTPRRRSNSLGQAPMTARLSSERAPPTKRAASTRT